MLLAQQSQSWFQLLDRVNPDALAAVLILTVIFGFASFAAIVMTIVTTYRNIALARLSKDMIEDLLAKGYTPAEIEPLVFGASPWSKMQRFFNRFGRKETACRNQAFNRPVRPVKT